MTVLAANSWRTNAELIADVAKLGYLRHEWLTLDPTYGRGTWWNVFRPEKLVTHDIRQDGIDFRDLPYDDGWFDAVAFDPPYVAVGGKGTSTLPGYHDRYGINMGVNTAVGVQELINAGLTECARVTGPRGFILVKNQDYVWSGKLWIGTHYTLSHGLSLGLELFDRFEHTSKSPRPQPGHKRQVHARRNLSTLLVFRKGKA